MPKIKEEHIITNLLVCRIKRGIEVNRSARLFLQMVRPKLKMLAHQAVRDSAIDLEVALADLESQTIEYLQHYYVLGEIAYPLHYLFGQPNGVMRHFANNYARKTRKYEDSCVLFDDNKAIQSRLEADLALNVDKEETHTRETQIARSVVDDGLSLSLLEYRVLKFCMHNALEARRPLNGLHVYLARTMNLVRARVTRIFKDACDKVREETHNSRLPG